MEWLNARDPMSAWTHFSWMILAIPGTVLLAYVSRKQPNRQIGMLVFGLSLIFCMACSFLYHLVPDEISEPFEAVDHIGMYILIAGSVTAIATVGLRGSWRIGLIALIWVLAGLGVGERLFTQPPLPVRTAFYLAMGWVGAVAYFQLACRLSHRKVSFIWIGGLFYTIGAVFNVCHWPNFASWFDSHALFHLFVMAGSLSHFLFLYVVLTRHREVTVPELTTSRGISEPAVLVEG